ncbi:HAD family hydrolase [Paenibacillus glycinis]|uniref:HAD hydrolase-like protein n=1 Tax=Paenibacillus glycinis TaxID=2697035 RepID=A0ABW9XSZ4_9BACL|nr:HAD family hydrolase [Paenibacillus glycinis]NBD25656.1 HAD hydrolase-like protein [Paenibacillus glycinis]
MYNENWLSAIKVVIFDMDGTLYQEDTFLERYIRYLLEGTEHEEATDEAMRLGRAIIAGEHAIGFGHFYHMRDDVGLVLEGERFVRGFTWEGAAIEEGTIREYGAFSEQAVHLIPIGDPWGVVTALGRKYRLPESKLRSAFDRVRQEMLLPPHRFERHDKLFEALEALGAVDKKILLTNTHFESGIAFMGYMGIRHLFDDVVCGANKPAGLHAYFNALLAQGYQAHEILSIGDNPWNDLHPAKKLGGRTCMISPYPSGDPEIWDLRLRRLDELEQLMRAIQESITRRNRADGQDRAEAYQQEVQG